MNPRLRTILVFLLLTAVAFITYYYALADVPRRDQTSYLSERAYVQNEWEWFWHSVSWSRTRFMGSGDSYLFRPLHMAVLALKDIFFRDNLFASGAVNILLVSLAGFSLYEFSRKIIKPVLAFALALLFMVQYAGIEMVAWGHISPYLLALAFLGFALASLLEAGPDNKAALIKTGAFLLLGALVHEMVVVALVFAAPLLLFVKWSKGKGAEIGGLPLRSYLLWVVAVPVLAYLGLDLLDYLYHGAPYLLGPLDTVAGGNSVTPFEAVSEIAGASAVAFLAPFKVVLAMGDTRLLAWNFESIRPLIVGAGAVLCLALVLGLLLCVRSIKGNGGSGLALALMLALLMFIGIVLGLGLGRLHLRGTAYLYNTTYYYSITAYLFCLLAAIGIHRMRKSPLRIPRWFLTGGVLAAVVPLLMFNIINTRDTLKKSWHFREAIARMHLDIDEALAEHSRSYCLSGALKGHPGTPFGNIMVELLRGRFCLDGDRRDHVYLQPGDDGSLWLAKIEKPPFGSFGKPIAVPLERTYEKGFMISDESYERPDISLTVRNSHNTIIYFGYENPKDMLAFEIEGSIVQGKTVTNGQVSLPLGQGVLQQVHPEQRLEVRHGDRDYFFVDGRLISAMENFDEGVGKIGVYLSGSGDVEPSYSGLMVAASAPAGAKAISFKPVLRLLERPDFAAP